MNTENDRRNHRRRWRRDDEKFIKDHFSDTNESLARKFGRTIKAIQNIKQKLKYDGSKQTINAGRKDRRTL